MGFLMGHSAWQIDQFPACWPMNGLFVHWSRGWGVSSFSERLVTVVLPVHPFPNLFIFFRFLPLKAEETYFFQEAITVFWQQWTCKQQYDCKVLIFSTLLLSLVLRITTSCKGKYYLFIHFQNFFSFSPQFLPLQVAETYFSQAAIAVSGFTSHDGKSM